MKHVKLSCVVVVTFLMVGLLAGFAIGADAASDAPAKASKLWKQDCSSKVGSKEYKESRSQLKGLIGSLSESEWVPVATALMQRGADDSTNAAALSLFGEDAISPDAVKTILANQNRTWPQRVLLQTCYRFIRPDCSGKISKKNRLQMIEALAGHIATLTKQQKVSYGEERLMSHLIQSALSRYAGQEKTVPQMNMLSETMHAYATAKGPKDMLAKSITDWMKMENSNSLKIVTEQQAVLLLGHWNPIVRVKASHYLASQVRKDKAVGDRVMLILNDPRDEVVASAVGVFELACSYKPKVVIKKMVELLTSPKSRVVVQQAAANTLIAHSDEAQTTVDMLLDALSNSKVKPGPKRTKAILETLSYLIHPQSPPSQKQRLRDVAVYYLEFQAPNNQPEGPERAEGALKALEALGSYAKPAVPNIKRYRDQQADRFMKQNIDRRVLPSIETP
ncbi:MAG: hypothetical protein KAR11_06440 [Phycisphaerae bacterium]|nr:hypothetical protein [Phycisphaerae bacterium]